MPDTVPVSGAAEIAPPPIMRSRDRAPRQPAENPPTSSDKTSIAFRLLLTSILCFCRIMSYLTPNGVDTNDRAVHNFNCAHRRQANLGLAISFLPTTIPQNTASIPPNMGARALADAADRRRGIGAASG